MTEQELIAAVARDSIAEIAPEEFPHVPDIQRAYFARSRTASPGKGHNATLDFGVGMELAGLAPVALAIVTEALTIVARKFGRISLERPLLP